MTIAKKYRVKQPSLTTIFRIVGAINRRVERIERRVMDNDYYATLFRDDVRHELRKLHAIGQELMRR